MGQINLDIFEVQPIFDEVKVSKKNRTSLTPARLFLYFLFIIFYLGCLATAFIFYLGNRPIDFRRAAARHRQCRGAIRLPHHQQTIVCLLPAILQVVEKAFRVSKGNLEMRPIFHFTERRIEAHICICFVAYKVYKELERVIRHAGIAMSVDKVLDIAKTIITIDVRTDGVHGVSKRTLFLTEEQKAIKQLFEMDTTKGD